MQENSRLKEQLQVVLMQMKREQRWSRKIPEPMIAKLNRLQLKMLDHHFRYMQYLTAQCHIYEQTHSKVFIGP